MTNRTFDIVIKDGLDRRHVVQGLELAMQIHNIRWATEFVSGKLSLYIGAFSKYLVSFILYIYRAIQLNID
jgi:hypothetical protein